MTPRALFVAFLLGSALGACGGDDSPSDAGIDGAPRGDGAVPFGLCRVALTYRATDSTPVVHVAGSWNRFDPAADALADDGTGTYVAELDLAPGIYPYKLVVEGDGREPWRLDPANHYRAYADGIENSGLRVPNCFVPALDVESAAGSRVSAGDGRIDATLHYDLRRAGVLASVRGELRSGRTTRQLDASELSVVGDEITVHVAGLADGKHTVASSPPTRTATRPSPCSCRSGSGDEFDWRDALIYMVMTDRFANGDPCERRRRSRGASPGADFRGGDLAGRRPRRSATATLDELGVRALWLTPVQHEPGRRLRRRDGVHSVTGYHGYWPVEPREVDPRLGGEAALDELVATAHAHGIRDPDGLRHQPRARGPRVLSRAPDVVQRRLHLRHGRLRLDRATARLPLSRLPARHRLDQRDASEQFIADAHVLARALRPRRPARRRGEARRGRRDLRSRRHASASDSRRRARTTS